MKIKNIIYKGTAVVAAMAFLGACSDKLDTLPDNRTTMDTPEKIAGLLVTAYPEKMPVVLNELMSDNTDYTGPTNPFGAPEGDMFYFWQDDKFAGNDSPEQFWAESYQSIFQANEALNAIEELGGATTPELQNTKGEALLIRAYDHFMLVNEFCRAYNSKTSATDPGIYYGEGVANITAGKEQAERGNVADVYAKIAADIEQAIPLINDNYTIPRYHFNKRAALAFATRFYLYYEKWDKAKEYADRLLGNEPTSYLRNYTALAALPFSNSQSTVRIGEAYCSADATCNLLIQGVVSNMGMSLGPWLTYKRYTHSNYLAETETIVANNIWGGQNALKWKTFNVNQGNGNMNILVKWPREFQTTNKVTQTGYLRSLYVVFTMDEALLNRAEAKIMLGENESAIGDLNTWMKNFFNTNLTLTADSIRNYYSKLPYAYADANRMVPSQKKHLHPRFEIGAEGSMQEALLQCVLQFKRIETLHQGLRWFDIKRYNIEIPRRLLGPDGTPIENIDWLTQDDPRQAVQIPLTIQGAGVAPNPR